MPTERDDQEPELPESNADSDDAFDVPDDETALIGGSELELSAHDLDAGFRRARRIAVTGATGFLGENLVGLLEEESSIARLVSIAPDPPSTAGSKTRHYDIDLTLPDTEEKLGEALAAENVDTLVHLAFLTAPSHAPTEAHELESVGTMHVLNACRRARVHKLVMGTPTLLYGARPTNPNFLTEHHALRADRREGFFADKMDAERDVLRFGRPGRGRVVTILRLAPMLGPSVQTFATRYLSRRWVPTVLGFDPLWQFLHEADAIAAIRLAVMREVPGVLNISGEGVLPLSTVIKLAGRTALPMPRSAVRALMATLWTARAGDFPASFVDYLQYVCVVDSTLAQKQLGFAPAYTTREALIDFANAQQLRDVNLLSETTA